MSISNAPNWRGPVFESRGGRLTGQGWLGHGAAFAGVEALSLLLAAELGTSKVRVLCLRLLAERAPGATLLGRLPTLADVAETAAFLVSARAQAMTATVANLTCGSLPD